MDILGLAQTWLLDHWQQEVTTIQNAPVAFLVLMVLCAFGWRLVFAHRFRSHDIRADAQQALIGRLESDVAEYKDRLNGASPDEVRAKIEALEAKVAQLDKPKA